MRHKSNIEPSLVKTFNGAISGIKMTDQVCLDVDEDICLEDFDFLSITDDVAYPV